MNEDLKNEMIAEATKRLELLGVLPQVVEQFKRGQLLFSERQNQFFPAALMELSTDSEFVDVVEEFNEQDIGLAYHGIKTYMQFGGPRYTILYVSKHKEYWAEDVNDLNEGYAFAYVSWLEKECGSVGVKPAMGGVLQTY